MWFRVFASSFAVIVTTIVHPLSAQSGSISGTVSRSAVDHGTLAQAEITLVARDAMSARTDSSGRYQITGVAPGRYLVLARAMGYRPRRDSVTIEPGSTVTLDFSLRESVVGLDTVVTEGARASHLSPRLRGFEERRRRGFGHFITEAELRQNDNRRLSDLMRMMPGMRVVREGPSLYAGSSRHADPKCFATVYLDGAVLYDFGIDARLSSGIRPPDLDDFAVSTLGGVEYYGGPASAPVDFRGSECGTLVLWTRER